MNYSGVAGPSAENGWKQINGSRCRRRPTSAPYDWAIVHTYTSSPGFFPVARAQHTVSLPSLPPDSARVFQSGSPTTGWLWETPDGKQTLDRAKARPSNVRGTILRTDGNNFPLNLGDPMPWCYGPAYQAFTDGLGGFVVTCDPRTTTTNSQGGDANIRGLSLCIPGGPQSDEGWKTPLAVAHLTGVAAWLIWCNREFDIPFAKLSGVDIRANRRGYGGHRDITAAFGPPGGHGDPGANFPWATVARLITNLQGGAMLLTVEGDIAAFVATGKTVTWIVDPLELFWLQQKHLLNGSIHVTRDELRNHYILTGPAPTPGLGSNLTPADFAGHIPTA